MNLSLKNRSKAFYIQLATGVIALISSILFLIIEITVVRGHISFPDNTIFTFLFVLVGGLLSLACCFTQIEFLAIISTILYGCGVGQHLFMSCYPYADLATGVAFFVDSGEFALTVSNIFTTFLVIFALLMVLSIVVCFLDKKQEQKA